MIGLHLEGPYLNPEKRGAHDPAYLSRPDPEVYHQWSSSTFVRLVTLAPELTGHPRHSDTGTERCIGQCGSLPGELVQAQAGFEAGIRYGTHLFNAMPALDHRQPGLAGAMMTNTKPLLV